MLELLTASYTKSPPGRSVGFMTGCTSRAGSRGPGERRRRHRTMSTPIDLWCWHRCVVIDIALLGKSFSPVLRSLFYPFSSSTHTPCSSRLPCHEMGLTSVPSSCSCLLLFVLISPSLLLFSFLLLYPNNQLTFCLIATIILRAHLGQIKHSQ